MIPKIIHYCWLSDEPYPSKIQYCINSWKRYLPDYEIILWDKERFDINSSKWVQQAYNAKKYAFAADYIRLYALYHYGGVYLDSDVEVVKTFNSLLHQPYFFGTENNEDIRIEAATIGVEPHNDFIHRCLQYYDERDFVVDGEMDLKPLPFIMMSYVSNYRLIKREEDFDSIEASDTLQIYSEDFFSPKDNVDATLHKTQNTYSIHHFNGSWLNKYDKLYNSFARFFGRRGAKVIMNIIVYLYRFIRPMKLK